jgi:hypothetical protein
MTVFMVEITFSSEDMKKRFFSVEKMYFSCEKWNFQVKIVFFSVKISCEKCRLVFGFRWKLFFPHPAYSLHQSTIVAPLPESDRDASSKVAAFAFSGIRTWMKGNQSKSKQKIAYIATMKGSQSTYVLWRWYSKWGLFFLNSIDFAWRGFKFMDFRVFERLLFDLLGKFYFLCKIWKNSSIFSVMKKIESLIFFKGITKNHTE